MAPGKYLILCAALLASALADGISFSEWPTSLTPGQPVSLKWVGGSGAPATITLRKGASTDLHDVQVLTNDAVNGEFSWTPPANLENSDDYAFQINQGDQVNYSGLVPLSGGVDAVSTQKNAVDMSSTESSTASSTASESTTMAAATTAATPSDSSSVSATTTEPTVSTSSTTAASTAGATTSSTDGSSGTTTSTSTQTASPSKMNTPFVASKTPSSTASASSSVQTGSAASASQAMMTVPLAVIGGSIAFLLLIQ